MILSTRPEARTASAPAARSRICHHLPRCPAATAPDRHAARTLAADIRMPWQQPCPPGRLTPARVRRGFRRIRQKLPAPASAPKPGLPGPGRPPGAKNRRPAIRHDVGKTVERTETKTKTSRQTG
jgi:hypothetical protein